MCSSFCRPVRASTDGLLTKLSERQPPAITGNLVRRGLTTIGFKVKKASVCRKAVGETIECIPVCVSARFKDTR
jgi:hypothetical protein